MLDVPISVDSPSFMPAFEALITDDIREPVAELAVNYLIEGGPNPKTSDEAGMVRFFEPSSTVADLELPTPAEQLARLVGIAPPRLTKELDEEGDRSWLRRLTLRSRCFRAELGQRNGHALDAPLAQLRRELHHRIQLDS